MNTTTALATDAVARPARPSGLVTPLATSVLVALDIDGTLLATGHAAPPETGNAVRALRLAGHHVVLASGRSLVGVLPVAHALGLTHTWVVASNGAVTARLDPMVSSGTPFRRRRSSTPSRSFASLPHCCRMRRSQSRRQIGGTAPAHSSRTP